MPDCLEESFYYTLRSDWELYMKVQDLRFGMIEYDLRASLVRFELVEALKEHSGCIWNLRIGLQELLDK
jgi:hypothetical protein